MRIIKILAVFVFLLTSLVTKAQTDTLPEPELPWQEPITIQVENFQTITSRGNKTTNSISIFNRDGLSIVVDSINSTLKTHFLKPSPVDGGTLRFDCSSTDSRSGWEFFNSKSNQSLLYIRQNLPNLGTGVGIGTANPKARLAVNGEMVAAKIRLTQNNWSDFVFDSSYNLLSLRDLEIFIAKNKHLPGIPSAEKVCKDDLDIGQTEAVLLEKVEELTLHLIAQDKALLEQERLLNEQSLLLQKKAARIAALERKIAAEK